MNRPIRRPKRAFNAAEGRDSGGCEREENQAVGGFEAWEERIILGQSGNFAVEAAEVLSLMWTAAAIG